MSTSRYTSSFFSPDDDSIAARDHDVDAMLDGADKRSDPRFEMETQAMVTIASLSSRPYEVREVSRGGMFLAFKERRAAQFELESHRIQPKSPVEIAFTVIEQGRRYQVQVQARIARITAQGIGVKYTTHNPPQLAPLRSVFQCAGLAEPGQVRKQTDTPRQDKPNESRKIDMPPASSDWQNWELED